MSRDATASPRRIDERHDPQHLSVIIALTGAGAAVAIGGFNYGIGTARSPGSGLVPFIVGVVMVVLGAALIISSRRQLPQRRVGQNANDIEPTSSPTEYPNEDDVLTRARFEPVVSLVICAAAFALVTFGSDFLGLLVTSAIAVGILAYLMRTSWWASLLAGGGFYLAGYLVFAMWLRLPLPFGTITGG